MLNLVCLCHPIIPNSLCLYCLGCHSQASKPIANQRCSPAPFSPWEQTLDVRVAKRAKPQRLFRAPQGSPSDTGFGTRRGPAGAERTDTTSAPKHYGLLTGQVQRVRELVLLSETHCTQSTSGVQMHADILFNCRHGECHSQGSFGFELLHGRLLPVSPPELSSSKVVTAGVTVWLDVCRQRLAVNGARLAGTRGISQVWHVASCRACGTVAPATDRDFGLAFSTPVALE